MKFEPTLHKLSNGVTVIFDPMDIETANMKILIKGGSRIEKTEEYGITHFLEHMLLNGTEKYPTNKIMRDLLADNGGTCNAGTAVAWTECYGRILAENFPVLMDVLVEMVACPLLSQSEINKERAIVIQEIKRSRDNTDRQFNGVVKKNLFPNSYLERYDTMGGEETLKTFNHEELVKYKTEKYTANNIIVAISGKFWDKEEILAVLEKKLGGIKIAPDHAVDPGKLNPSIVYDVRNDKKQTKIFIGFDEMYPDERKYDYEEMCVAAFESALIRRLIEDVRLKKGLAYSFGMSGYGDRFLGCNGFMTALSPEKLQEMIASIASGCYDIIHRNPITQEELNRKKTMVKLGHADFFESSIARLDKLIGFYASYGDLYDPAEFDVLRAKMNVDDVMKYSKDYFSRTISIIAQGPECEIDMKAIWDENFK
jgi:predicted Zn-dependent peptidase